MDYTAKNTLILLVVLLGAPYGVMAAEAGADKTWDISYQFDVFQMPATEAFPVVADLLNSQKAAEAFRQLEAGALRPNPAPIKRIARLIARAPDGTQTRASQHQKHQYASGYQLPDYRIGTIQPTNESTGFPMQFFDSREAGVTMVVEGYVAEGGSSLSILYSGFVTRFDRWHRFVGAIRPTGERTYVDHPEFVSRRTVGILHTKPNIPVLVGGYRILEDRSLLELHILTTRLRSTDRFAPLPAPVIAEPGEESAKPNFGKPLSMELFKLRLPVKDAIIARQKLLDPTQCTEAFHALIEKARSGAIEWTDWHVLSGFSGGRWLSENAREIRYGIELPPMRPPPVFGNHGGVQFDPTAAVPKDTSIIAPISSFETRDTGTFLAVDHSTDAPGGRDGLLTYQLNSVQHPLIIRWKLGVDYGGGLHFREEPEFLSQRTSGVLPMKPGVTLLGFDRCAHAPSFFDLTLLKIHP